MKSKDENQKIRKKGLEILRKWIEELEKPEARDEMCNVVQPKYNVNLENEES